MKLELNVGLVENEDYEIPHVSDYIFDSQGNAKEGVLKGCEVLNLYVPKIQNEESSQKLNDVTLYCIENKITIMWKSFDDANSLVEDAFLLKFDNELSIISDANENKFTANFIDGKTARDVLLMVFSLQNCTGCTNCVNCVNCTGCTKCVECTDCVECFSSAGCIECERCTVCMDCVSCTECEYCSECTNCEDCIECKNCDECIECSNCSGVSKQNEQFNMIFFDKTKEEFEKEFLNEEIEK